MSRKAQQRIEPIDATPDTPAGTVFSNQRTVQTPTIELPPRLKPNTRLEMEGLEFLALVPESTIPVAFFDPQYRGVLEKLAYGNEGKARGRRRCALEQMSEAVIGKFIRGIDRALAPSGHLFLWVDKFHLCQGVREWRHGTGLDIVDMLTWDKGTFGMGYRTRRRAEYCIVLQKQPRKAKGVWKVHNIPDVISEQVSQREHPHAKPVDLQGQLISAVTDEEDFVIDPAAGSFSVMQAALEQQRNFLGCDLNG
jgi:site-specific DNA-methyltransferase (adenine-specific)